MNVDKTTVTRIESELDTKRKKLGVDDALCKIPGVTTKMLIAFGKHGIKTIADLADCATDDLIGWVERKSGKSTRHAGALEGFAIKRKEAEAIIMQARVKAGWIEESELTPPESAEREAVAEPKLQAHKNTLWDIKFETREEAYAPIADDLAAFKQHKKALLDELRSGRKPALKSKPFDEEKSWNDLISLAQLYLWGENIKQEAIPAADRVKRLRQLATALRRAHGLADRAMQDDVGNDLFRACCAEKSITLASSLNGGGSPAVRVADEIKEVVAGLATLETAARRAANDMRTKPGRPTGTAILPADCIQGLRRVFQNCTGSKPGGRDGPFARFVSKFLAAIGRDTLKNASVIDAIKDSLAGP